ncbi:GNAT family N-acetyltransferase [Thalassobaculum sp. OXR-137]|uniref:GNAT family N-acetyltransferase n=1 Tax=Thalassobaculum sp. OXR-137 TaxID=3100173 RepID=UPI002AC8DF5A|nr:GNAT family N-acetyltransferase [Thalassobaculum sp. OXR-137]WPZ32416.1 GNAT family N-acetyltransferase [Thalassobaculum sp. OXR-137]
MIDYRPALASDAPAIARILRRSMRTAMPWLPDLHTPEEDLWFVENRLLPDGRVTVATDSGDSVGYMALSAGGDWIEHLYLLPTHWRRGIGTELLRRAQGESAQLQLWAFQRNMPARRFYERHGFRAVEVTDGAGNEEKTPDVRYLWRADGSQFAAPALTFREMEVADIAPALEMRFTTNENAITPERLERDYGVTVESLIPRLSAELKGWLCESDGQVVGFSMADRSDGEVEVLAVRPGYEGFGIGRRLLELAVAWLREEGCSPIWLCATPDPNLRASAVYRHLGWHQTGRRVGEDEVLELTGS